MEKSPWRQLKEKLLNSSKYVSPDAAKDKKRFKIEVEDFVMKHKNMLRKMEKDCLKESGGLSNLFLLILGRISKTTASARKNIWGLQESQ